MQNEKLYMGGKKLNMSRITGQLTMLHKTKSKLVSYENFVLVEVDSSTFKSLHN